MSLGLPDLPGRFFNGMFMSSGIGRCFCTCMFPKIMGKPPKSSISMGCSIINHLFWGTMIFGNTRMFPEAILIRLEIAGVW